MKNKMLEYLSNEDQKIFLDELLDAIKNKNFDDVLKCIESWEATAELNSIPGFQKRIVKKIKKMKKVWRKND